MRKVMRYALLMPAMIGLCVSCAEEKTDVKLLEGKWNIVEVSGEAIGEDAHPFMEFNLEEKKIHGNASCNLFNAALELSESDCSAIRVGNAITTMMACPNMDMETKVLQAMDQVRSVEQGATEAEMCLLNEEGATVVRLTRP